ncbi:uncharacterized protein LOC143767059 [Ranitomeya variabilis]|uniref:uncharacterized protein LOC143767059 n=1 Tax=Ranitomeya variabilis TaxID=490064 RepID=UPI00405609A4
MISIYPTPPEDSWTIISTSTVAETGQEQRSHGRVARRQRVPERDEDLIENDLLISLVQERVPLWDTWVPQHSDNVTMRRLWNEVGWLGQRPDLGPKCICGQSQNMLAFDEGPLQQGPTSREPCSRWFRNKDQKCSFGSERDGDNCLFYSVGYQCI